MDVWCIWGGGLTQEHPAVTALTPMEVDAFRAAKQVCVGGSSLYVLPSGVCVRGRVCLSIVSSILSSVRRLYPVESMCLSILSSVLEYQVH